MRHLAAVLPLLAWLISSGLTILTCAVLRTVTVAVADALTRNASLLAQAERGQFVYWLVSAADQFSVFCLGVIGLALVVAYDYLYRAARREGKLLARIGLVTGIQEGLLLASWIVLALLRPAGL